MTDELVDLLPKEKTQLDDNAFLDPTARIVGDVMLSDNSSLWPGSVLDGDKSKIEVGKNSIVMNNTIIKSTEDNHVILGENSLISPGAKIEGSKIGKNVLVGMDTVIMENVEVGNGSVIGTDSIVPEGTKIPENSIVRGRPAEVVGEVDEETRERIDKIRDHMFRKRDEYKIMMNRGDRYDVFDTPRRPKEVLESKKEELFSEEDKEEIESRFKKALNEIDSGEHY